MSRRFAAMPGGRPGGNRALADALGVVRHHGAFGHLVDPTEPVASWTCARRRIGRERLGVEMRLVAGYSPAREYSMRNRLDSVVTLPTEERVVGDPRCCCRATAAADRRSRRRRAPPSGETDVAHRARPIRGIAAVPRRTTCRRRADDLPEPDTPGEHDEGIPREDRDRHSSDCVHVRHARGRTLRRLRRSSWRGTLVAVSHCSSITAQDGRTAGQGSSGHDGHQFSRHRCERATTRGGKQPVQTLVKGQIGKCTLKMPAGVPIERRRSG